MLIAVASVLLLLGVGALSVLSALGIRGHLEQGRDHLARAQAALLGGDPEAASDSFARARGAFQRARVHPGTLLLVVEGFLPFIGRTSDALLTLGEIGETVSAAGEDVSSALAALPGGLSSLGLKEGRIPLRQLRSVAPAVRRARVSLDRAEAQASQLPSSWLLGPVARARDLVRSRVAQVVPVARAADALLRSLPAFAGERAPRRYFVAIQNSAELRGTGGLIGNYAILTIDRGRLSLGPFGDTSALPSVPASTVPAPSKDFASLYNPFGGGGFWLNINMTPDAPTAAGLIEALYQRVQGTRLDGTLFVDLLGIERMLEATGPVSIDRLGITIGPENLIPYVATAAYLRSGIPNPHSTGPRLVADAIWGRFLSAADPERAFRSLVGMAADGHLMLHAADPEVQAAFRSAGLAGELRAGEGDFLGVVLTNAAANKVDYFLKEAVRYDVWLGPGGTARAVATVRLVNDAPAGQPSSYLLGPKTARAAGLGLVPGENRSWASVYCPTECSLSSFRDDAGDLLLEEHREQGLRVFAAFVNAKPQSTRELRFDLELRDVWDGDGTGGQYRLRLHGQALVNPAQVDVTIRAPDGMDVVWTSDPMEIDGPTAVWHGRLHPPRDLVVRFTKPLPARIWTRVWDFLSKPVLRL